MNSKSWGLQVIFGFSSMGIREVRCKPGDSRLRVAHLRSRSVGDCRWGRAGLGALVKGWVRNYGFVTR